ncbi:glycogen debranching protein GlgX [Alteromonas sp. a30]|uniref:glycogen debranching protein GlgX n=1 Tax=Alteromonas sp. a30 TaxID=2730917 RepID=UPI00228179EC|nr:glycogen debranching protein GlgX [Alteromonas sp. a30]MCY7294031.1 glycogen debranching protein GlgX [Alteromonas sp. a30]
MTEGKPYPFGATLTSTGCNFALHGPFAEKVELCLFDAEDTLIQAIPLPKKTGKVWHAHIKGVREGARYGYRVTGPNLPELGFRFEPNKLLLDPYAKALSKPYQWDAEAYHANNEHWSPKAVVTNHDFDWQGTTKPDYPLEDVILYEVHVKGMTQQHPQVPPQLQGKYLGLCHPPVVEHLKTLGVTSVQLLPVSAFMSEPYIANKGLCNYWGYNPVNFFSPDPRYAVNDAVVEFKTMVRTFHQAGIEVILDVVFNHTAEGGTDGPILSFRGIDNSAFYLFERNESGGSQYQRLINNSGCGNSVNTAHHYPMRMVLDALRYWYQEMGVDGFRFDLAASLGRDPYEFSSDSGFFRALRQDPILHTAKLIAEPWDIGVGGYRLGQFPSNWVECNDKYRDNVRGFWRGDKGLTSEFATRLLGSRDVFWKNHRHPQSSVNYIAYHDGFTLHDLVSYNEKHNEANLEGNRDGHGHNVSFNYGEEGETLNHDINLTRERQKRNLITTLMLSQGIPHFLGGDELSRSQQGNNNAYCQDNPISWYNWKLDALSEDFLEFCAFVIHLRKHSKLLRHLNQSDDSYLSGRNVKQVCWLRPDGKDKVEDDWHDHDNQAFAVQLEGDDDVGEHWFILFNAADHDVKFNMPSLKDGQTWQMQLDTRYQKLGEVPSLLVKDDFVQAYRSLAIFKAS